MIKELNFVLNLERKNINVLKDLINKEEITETDDNHLTLGALALAYYMVWPQQTS